MFVLRRYHNKTNIAKPSRQNGSVPTATQVPDHHSTEEPLYKKIKFHQKSCIDKNNRRIHSDTGPKANADIKLKSISERVESLLNFKYLPVEITISNFSDLPRHSCGIGSSLRRQMGRWSHCTVE